MFWIDFLIFLSACMAAGLTGSLSLRESGIQIYISQGGLHLIGFSCCLANSLHTHVL